MPVLCSVRQVEKRGTKFFRDRPLSRFRETPAWNESCATLSNFIFSNENWGVERLGNPKRIGSIRRDGNRRGGCHLDSRVAKSTVVVGGCVESWVIYLSLVVQVNESAGRNDDAYRRERERAAVCNENIKKPLELIGVGVKQFHSREQKAALATKLRSWKSAILFNASRRPVARKTLYAVHGTLARAHTRAPENFLLR